MNVYNTLNLTCKKINESISTEDTKFSKKTILTYVFDDYRSIKDLMFNCNQSVIAFSVIFYLQGQTSLIFDNSIDFNFFKLKELSSFTIILLNIKGFKLNTKIYKNVMIINKIHDRLSRRLEISQSHFNLYIEKDIVNSLWTYANYSIDLNDFAEVSFLDSVKFMTSKYCPFLLNKNTIPLFEFQRFYDTFLIKNFLSFSSSNLNMSENLYSNITILKMTIFNIKLDNYILNQMVYKKTIAYYFQGVLSSIDRDTFKDLRNAKRILFSFRRFSKILEKPLSWINSINYDINIEDRFLDKFLTQNLTKVAYLGFNLNDYSFKDEDFCMFAKFPFNQAIFTSVLDKINNCSCTIIWLTKYMNIYKKHIRSEILSINKMSKFYSYDTNVVPIPCFLAIKRFINVRLRRDLINVITKIIILMAYEKIYTTCLHLTMIVNITLLNMIL